MVKPILIKATIKEQEIEATPLKDSKGKIIDYAVVRVIWKIEPLNGKDQITYRPKIREKKEITPEVKIPLKNMVENVTRSKTWSELDPIFIEISNKLEKGNVVVQLQVNIFETTRKKEDSEETEEVEYYFFYDSDVETIDILKK